MSKCENTDAHENDPFVIENIISDTFNDVAENIVVKWTRVNKNTS